MGDTVEVNSDDVSVEPEAPKGGGETVGSDVSPSPKPNDAPRTLHGRAPLVTSYDAIDKTNVADALNEVLPAFGVNVADIEYLWGYYKGRQPILLREKPVRPEINNRIVENHAQEIVAFKLGYQLAEPLQYTCRKADGEGYDEHSKDVNELNTLMYAEDKEAGDRDLFEWMLVAGTACRMVLARAGEDEDGCAPFELFALDPRKSGVARKTGYRDDVAFGFIVGTRPRTCETFYTVYTDKFMYEVENGRVVASCAHTYGSCPIVEYKLNNARMGVFEPVLPLLDAIDKAESDRINGIEQTVQCLMKFINVDISKEDFKEIMEVGGIKLESREGRPGDVDILRNDLDQTQTQITKDDMYQAVLNICGMPNRSTGSASADTGAAVLLRDGWTLAESHAKSYELQMKRSERDALRVVLSICRQSASCDIDLRIRDIELKFNRRNYENILTKAQTFTTLIQSKMLDPEVVFQVSGLFTDPEAAWTATQKWLDEKASEAPALPEQNTTDDNGNIGPQAGQPELGGDGAVSAEEA